MMMTLFVATDGGALWQEFSGRVQAGPRPSPTGPSDHHDHACFMKFEAKVMSKYEESDLFCVVTLPVSSASFLYRDIFCRVVVFFLTYSVSIAIFTISRTCSPFEFTT